MLHPMGPPILSYAITTRYPHLIWQGLGPSIAYTNPNQHKYICGVVPMRYISTEYIIYDDTALSTLYGDHSNICGLPTQDTLTCPLRIPSPTPTPRPKAGQRERWQDSSNSFLGRGLLNGQGQGQVRHGQGLVQGQGKGVISR